MSQHIIEILKFCVVGGLTFVFDYNLLYCLTEFLGLSYLWSSAISFVIAVVVNYVLCLLFVFRNANSGWKQIILFVVTSVVGVGLNQLCMWGFVEKLGMYYMLAKIGATAIVTVWNYVTKKKAMEL